MELVNYPATVSDNITNTLMMVTVVRDAWNSFGAMRVSTCSCEENTECFVQFDVEFHVEQSSDQVYIDRTQAGDRTFEHAVVVKLFCSHIIILVTVFFFCTVMVETVLY